MWGTLYIEHENVTYRYKCNDRESIYWRLMQISHGNHVFAESVCNWAEIIASIGDEYETDIDGLSIWIEEE